MVCVALGHRMNQLGRDPESKALAEKFYEYWGLSARYLSKHLEVKKNQPGNYAIAGILMLLPTDVSQYPLKHCKLFTMLTMCPVTAPTRHLA